MALTNCYELKQNEMKKDILKILKGDTDRYNSVMNRSREFHIADMRRDVWNGLFKIGYSIDEISKFFKRNPKTVTRVLTSASGLVTASDVKKNIIKFR